MTSNDEPDGDYDVLTPADAKAWLSRVSYHPDGTERVTPEFIDQTVDDIETGLLELRRDRATGAVTPVVTDKGNALIDEDEAAHTYFEKDDTN